MPAFSQSEMAVDAKAIRSFYSQNPTQETSYSVIRPLGLLRNDVQENQRRYQEKMVDDYYSVDFNCSDSDDSNQDETSCHDRVDITTTESFLQQTEDPPNSRGGSATQRRWRENAKTTRTTRNRVIQLPMLKLNLDAITGAKNNEDFKTLENTRRSLKTLIDDGKKAIKNELFLTSGDKNKDQSKDSKSEDRLCAVQTLSLNGDYYTPSKLPPAAMDPSSARKVSRSMGPTYGNHDAIYSVALTNAVDIQDPDSMQLTTEYNSSRSLQQQDFTHDNLFIDLVSGSDSSKPSPVTFYDMAAWPSYDEVQNLRSTGNKGCSKHALLLKKHRFQQELMEQRLKARRDQSRSWVNINTSNYKANTAYKGNHKLEPISVSPQNGADHCPMCNMYRVSKVSTPCPPNSPKEKNNNESPQLRPIIEDVNEQNSGTLHRNPQTPISPTSLGRYQDLNKLAPVTAASMAKTQGFRGSKPPITFMMCYNKGNS